MMRRSASLSDTSCSSDDLPTAMQPTSPAEPEAAMMTTARPRRASSFIVLLTFMASLGGILFGYDLGVIASALPPMTKELNLSNPQQEWVVSILYIGGGIGALVGGALADAWGRLNTILLVDVCFAVGALVLFLAPSLSVILVGRVIVGFAISVSAIADVAYLNEIAPVEYRGAVVSVNEACISLGFLLAFVTGSLLEDEWRIMFGVGGFIALTQFLGMYGMPESPVWLEQQGRSCEAEVARQQIQSTTGYDYSSFCRAMQQKAQNAAPSYHAVESSSVEPRLSVSEGETMIHTTAHLSIPFFPQLDRYIVHPLLSLLHQLYDFFHVAMTEYRRQTWIALFLAITQQLCGQTNVLSYANVILSSSHRNDDNDPWATLWVGIVKFFVTSLVIWKIEVVGRRFFLLAGMFTIALGLGLLVLAFVDVDNNPNDAQPTMVRLNIALPGMLLVVCGYSVSFGPLTWLLTSELFPAEIRGRALGFEVVVTNLGAAIVTATFLSAQSLFGTSTVFGFYLTVTVLGMLFAYLAIPDTREKSPQDLEHDLRRMPWWRHSCTRLNDSSNDSSPLFGSVNDGSACSLPESELPSLT